MPAHGTATIVNGGTQITYTLTASGQPPTDSFGYTISGGQGGTDSATVSITNEWQDCTAPPGQQPSC